MIRWQHIGAAFVALGVHGAAAQEGVGEEAAVPPQAEAGRLHAELSTLPYTGMPAEPPVTVSIGAVALEHETMLDSDALLRAADMALYEAKRRGKNRVVVGNLEGEQQ